MNLRLHVLRAVCVALIAGSSLPTGAAQPPSVGERSQALSKEEQARQWMSMGLHQKAQWLLEEHLRNLPRSESREEPLFLLMQCFFEQNRFEEAYQTSTELLIERPDGERRFTALFVQGVSAYHTERFDGSVRAHSKLLQDRPTYPRAAEAHYWLAMAYLELGQGEEAEEHAKLAYEGIQPEQQGKIGHDNALMLWGVALERRGKVSEARDIFEQLLREAPESKLVIDARIRLASIALRREDPRAALQHLIAVQPQTTRQRHEWLFLKGEAEFWNQEYDKAQESYTELLRRFPGGTFSRQARLGLAWSLLKLENLNSARQEFSRLSEGSDSIALSALYHAGAIALVQGDAADAVRYFEQLVERFPYERFADKAYYSMGLVRYRAQQYREARRNFQLAARLFPESELRPAAYYMLGEASVALGDMRNAQFAFGQAHRLQPPRGPADRSRQETRLSFLSSPPDLRAAAMFREGIALYHLGRFNSAAERFDEFIAAFRHHPRFAEAHFWRGEAAYQAGRYDEAENSFASAIDLMAPGHQKRAEAIYGLAWSLFEQKKFRPAIAAFDRFINENPKSERLVEATLRKADCYFFLRDYERSSQLYASIGGIGGDSRFAEYAAFQLGLSFIQRGEPERGIAHLRDFLRRYPTSIYVEVVHFNIAWTYYSNERYQQALDEFDRFRQLYPESQLMPRVLLNSGDAHYNLAQYDDARARYRQLIEEYPQSLLVPDAINGLQFTYQAEGRAREAVAAIEAILARQADGGNSEELLLRKGDLLFEQGDFGQAGAEYLRLLERNPSPPIQSRVLHQLARIYEFENNLRLASSFYEKVVTGYPESEYGPPSLLALGHMQIKQNQWGPAAAQFRRFEQLYPDSPLRWEAEYYIGVCLINQKDSEGARRQFERIIHEAPRDEVFADRSRLQIARTLQARKQYAAAIDMLADVVTRRDDDIAAEALLLLGENYLALKRPSDALDAFTQVIEGFPHHPLLVERALLGTGECYERLNDRPRARSSYEQVISSAVDAAVRKDAEDRLRRLRR